MWVSIQPHTPVIQRLPLYLKGDTEVTPGSHEEAQHTDQKQTQTKSWPQVDALREHSRALTGALSTGKVPAFWETQALCQAPVTFLL